LQPRHISCEPAWAILEHELAAQIHITMKQYFHKLKEMEPDNAFRPDTLVSHCCCVDCSKHPTSIAVGTCSCPFVICACTKVQPCYCDHCAFRQLAYQQYQPTQLPVKQLCMCLLEWILVFNPLPAFDAIIWPTCSSTLQVRAILYIATLTTGIMEAVTNVDHAVAEALSTRHHPHSPANSTTRSARKLRVQAAILMPVREALKTLHESEDCTWKGLCLSL